MNADTKALGEEQEVAAFPGWRLRHFLAGGYGISRKRVRLQRS
jgi:hypothetical protein